MNRELQGNPPIMFQSAPVGEDGGIVTVEFDRLLATVSIRPRR